MIDFAKAAGMIITPTVLKSIGVVVAGVFITMAVILALSALAYYAYQVVMEDGNIFNLFFLPDSVFIGDTQIIGFTKSIAEMTNFFETRMKENPNEEVAKPEGGTDTGEGDGEVLTLMWNPRDSGIIWSNFTKKSAGNNGLHVEVLYKGKVYCNVHPYELPEQQWIDDFTCLPPAVKLPVGRLPF